MKYPNLRAEMARRGIKVGDIAKTLNLSYSATYSKISGRSNFTLTELLAIKRRFFPDKTLDYLFGDS